MRNVRDVGGLPVAGGGRICPGLLFRGDAPAVGDAPPGLSPWPPATVIDLRSASEHGAAHPLAGDQVTVHALPLSSELGVRELAEEGRPLVSLDALYRRMVRERGGAIAQVVTLVAQSPGPVLVHCTAGKDRTGVVIAAILGATGVRRADIVADYVATEPNMPAVVARVSAVGRHVATAVDVLLAREPHLLGAPAGAIGAVLDEFELAGGPATWLEAHGTPRALVKGLAERLVERPSPCF